MGWEKAHAPDPAVADLARGNPLKPNQLLWAALSAAFLCTAVPRIGAAPAAAEDPPFVAGADVSALPSLEKVGAVYRDGGVPGDALAILRAHGCNLFRVRLFVAPDPHAPAGGAGQDLDQVIALAKRVRAAHARLLLDLHYADTWADPTHQPTPAAWRSLGAAAMVRRVHDYTADVLRACAAAGVTPDLVQVGNEITAGILWPTALLYKATGEQEEQQWRTFARLLDAGCRAVREASTPGHPIRIVIHVDHGGRDMPVWFFRKLAATPVGPDGKPVEFDVIGLSFYPAWGDSMDVLKRNLAELIRAYGRDVLICETSYPWRPLSGIHSAVMDWPQTPGGQERFLDDLNAAVAAAPSGHGMGYVWWYPEAVPVPGQHVWRGGYEAWFDGQGNLLPAAESLGVRAR
jgi:arabinogalactan endo-1,4-beta-galactosidase